HVGLHRRGVAGARGGRRHRDQSERSPHRYVSRIGRGRPAREQDRFRGAHHAPADRHRRRVPGRALAAQEQSARAVAARGEAARCRDPETRERNRRAPQEPRRHRRPLGAHSHVQLPAGTRHRPPHQPDAAQARSDSRGRARRRDRAAHQRVPRRSAPRARRRQRMNRCEPARTDSLRCGELVRQAAARLEAISDTPKLDAELLVAHAAGATRSAVIAFPERALDMDAARRLDALIERRAAGEPLAYLVGEKEFYSLALAVSPAVLVPRPETEHLVDAALARLANVERPSVLDLGTGSGALALAIKHERRDAIVVGADASADALTIARANGERLGLEVEWLESDWFAALAGRTFDCIVCNPPYLASDDPHFARLGFE